MPGDDPDPKPHRVNDPRIYARHNYFPNQGFDIIPYHSPKPKKKMTQKEVFHQHHQKLNQVRQVSQLEDVL